MKWFFIVAAVFLVVIIAKMYPMVYQEKACYDKTQKTIEDIQYFIVSRGITKEDVCNSRSLALLDLNDCLKNATSGSTLAKYTNSIIDGVVYLVRPLTKSLGVLKSEHNADCMDYTRFQVQ